jgi:hypothetical protein
VVQALITLTEQHGPEFEAAIDREINDLEAVHPGSREIIEREAVILHQPLGLAQ